MTQVLLSESRLAMIGVRVFGYVGLDPSVYFVLSYSLQAHELYLPF